MAFCAFYSRNRCLKLPLPPGPRKLPFLGNLLNAPSKFPWETYMTGSKEYNSDIIHLNLLGQSVIALSSLEATDTLLEKRSVKHSDSSKPYIADAAHALLKDLLQAPDDRDSSTSSMGQFIMSVAYGINVFPSDDPYIALAHNAI
ncbi:hypothetical protein B0H19DRAFT_1378701 [Mycena capillaripes]|nr:hypothetical protein B0H19DRAFT_1378701 [Mycena capillaripes]